MVSPPSPAILAAHPGHELRLFGWLSTTHPLIIVLTNGSGGTAAPRTHFSAAVAAEYGARTAPLFGEYTDRELYRWLLDGETSRIDALLTELRSILAAEKIGSLICDGYEGYNPVHDLTHALALRLGADLGIPVYEHLLVATSEDHPRYLSLDLDDATFERKLAAVERYQPLKQEFDRAVDHEGLQSLRREILRPVKSIDLERFEHIQPFYETYGEQQVRAGIYRDVIRYHQHVRPMLMHTLAGVLTSA